MSRSRRRRGPRDTRGSKPAVEATRPTRRGGSNARTALVIITIVLLGVLAWWGSRRWTAPHPTRQDGAAIVPVPLDSVAPAARMFEAATMRSDWAEARYWQERIAAALPTNPLALRQLAQVLHNHHFAITLPDGRQRWLLRNSLIRAQWEARVRALFDSSAAVTSDFQDHARAHYWKGRSAEHEGLPLDALAEYEAALALAPGDTTLQRARDAQRRKLFAEP